MNHRRPTLQRFSTPISIGRAAVPPTNGAANPYGPAQDAHCRVWRRYDWFACLGRRKETHKKKEKHGALALGGCHLVITHNNQPIVGRSSRGDVGEKARVGQSIWEGVVPSLGATIGTTKIYVQTKSHR